ncbi:MAG: GatB/YqeY domain-containing protein [Candidatus Parcubacteria bacterium]|nr:GatB/YqeY domain-containing protein [Candidatus Parcubacteria bacterium]
MNFKEKIEGDFKGAFKGKDAVKLGALKMLRAEIHNAEIAKRKELDEGEIIEVVLREIKKCKDAAVLYEQGKRSELAEKEKAEIKVLSIYLPEQISEEEVRNLVKKAIEQSGATSVKEMGKVMSILMSQIKGKADNSLVSNMVKEMLG